MRAFLTLLTKELRALWPLGLLGFALISGDLISRPLTERIDENTYDHVAGIGTGEGGFLAFLFWLLAFFVAYAAFPREHDERTIELLYALPLRRRSIFFAKALAGALTLTLVAAMGQGTNFVLQALNPDSVEGHQMQPDLVLRIVFLHATVAVVLYAHGLFASLFRLFGALPYVFLFFVLAFVGEMMPELGWLNPGSIVRAEYEGSALLMPWGTIGFHVAVALGVGVLAYVGWMTPNGAVRDALATRSTLSLVALGGGSVAVLVTGMVLFVVWVGMTYDAAHPPVDPSEEHEVAPIAFGTAEARTSHYAFIYASSFEERALRLVRRSDRVLETDGAIVGATTLPFISVDLAEVSAHHEGIASGTRIRMGAQEQPDWRLLHVLAHESAHVLQNEVSRRYLMEHGQTTRFFIEGGAEWVAFEALSEGRLGDAATDEEVREDRELRRASRIVAAASWERHRIRVEDSFDDSLFRAQFDTVLAYPYGETFAEAVARACGDAAVGATFRTFGREGAPQDVEGEALFRDAFASIGCDYEAVLAAHDALMQELVTTERAAIDTIPRLEGGVVGRVRVDASEASSEGEGEGEGDANVDTTMAGMDVVRLEATLDRPPLPHERYSVRYRLSPAAADTEVRGVRGRIVEGSSPRRVVFDIPVSSLTVSRFEYLFSLEVDARAFPYSERWQSAPVP